MYWGKEKNPYQSSKCIFNQAQICSILFDLLFLVTIEEILPRKAAKSMSKTTASTSSSPKIEELEEIPDQHQKNAEFTDFFALNPCIITNILTRLPVRVILKCRYVCKPWRNLILDPYFAKTYLTKPPVTSIILFIDDSYYMLELGNDYAYTRPCNKPIKFNINIDVPIQMLEILGSCNGFLCFKHSYSKENYLYLSNPILGEYVALPVPKREKMDIRDTFGLGFSLVSGVYKVVRIVLKWVRRGIMTSYSEICTVGSGTWRKMGDVPFPLSNKLGDANLNGCFHWISDHFEKQDYLYSFDIEKEELTTIPPPPRFVNKTIWMSLGVFGKCLCIFDNSFYSHLDIWAMKRYGVAESWTNYSILKTSIPRTPSTSWIRPITIWQDREILISSSFSSLVSYNPISKSFKEVEILGFKPLSPSDQLCQVPVVAFAPNFFSLTDVIGVAQGI